MRMILTFRVANIGSGVSFVFPIRSIVIVWENASNSRLNVANKRVSTRNSNERIRLKRRVAIFPAF